MISENTVCIMSQHHLGFLPSRDAEVDAVPQSDRAAAVRLEVEEVRQLVFGAEQVGNHENTRRQELDLNEEEMLPG